MINKILHKMFKSHQIGFQYNKSLFGEKYSYSTLTLVYMGKNEHKLVSLVQANNYVYFICENDSYYEIPPG